jgi:glyoxylase-like metal-dependent hydrolase (beta-lactamase superfamily II)
MIRLTGEQQRHSGLAETPDVAGDLAEVVLDPPDHTFTDRATLDLDGRVVDLAFLGRGHTDNDIVITIADADVMCVGDLLENGAPPWFGDGYPMDWPATARAILDRTGERTVVVPGHGAHAGRAFVEQSLGEIRAIADLSSRVHAGDLDLEAAVAAAPYRPAAAREALERGVAQLNGQLGPGDD